MYRGEDGISYFKDLEVPARDTRVGAITDWLAAEGLLFRECQSGLFDIPNEHPRRFENVHAIEDTLDLHRRAEYVVGLGFSILVRARTMLIEPSPGHIKSEGFRIRSYDAGSLHAEKLCTARIRKKLSLVSQWRDSATASLSSGRRQQQYSLPLDASSPSQDVTGLSGKGPFALLDQG